VAAVSTLLLPVALGLQSAAAVPVGPAPVGQGFTVNAADLSFILKQIKIAERHSRAFLSTDPSIPANPDPTGDPNYCQSMIGTRTDQIPDPLTSYGLRTVDGSCNNLVPGNAKFGAADQPFPRYAAPSFRAAEPITAALPVGPLGPTSYAQLQGNVVDSQPRMISNLIVDQTATNPAAVAAAGHPVRSQANAKGVVPCQILPAIDPITLAPVVCVPAGQTLDIPNVTTDIGLSPPYNSLFKLSHGEQVGVQAVTRAFT